MEEVSCGLKKPWIKGKRLIKTHIGSSGGFVDDDSLLFKSKKTKGFHEDMVGSVFENWIENILEKLPPRTGIFMCEFNTLRVN